MLVEYNSVECGIYVLMLFVYLVLPGYLLVILNFQLLASLITLL